MVREAASVPCRTLDSITETIDELQQDLDRRAYEIFQTHAEAFSAPLDDWLTAERELVWTPAIELSRRADVFQLRAALAGVDRKDLDIRVTPEDLVIAGPTSHSHDADETVYAREFVRGRLFRRIHFPERINPDQVTAEFRDGLLRLSAPVAQPMRQIEVSPIAEVVTASA